MSFKKKIRNFSLKVLGYFLLLGYILTLVEKSPQFFITASLVILGTIIAFLSVPALREKINSRPGLKNFFSKKRNIAMISSFLIFIALAGGGELDERKKRALIAEKKQVNTERRLKEKEEKFQNLIVSARNKFNSGDFSGSYNDYVAAESLKGLTDDTDKKIFAGLTYNRAVAAQEKHNYSEAEAKLIKTISLIPDYKDSGNRLVSIKTAVNKKKAEAAAEEKRKKQQQLIAQQKAQAEAEKRKDIPIIKFIETLEGNSLVEQVGWDNLKGSIVITVSNAWHYEPYQIRKQAAQNLQQIWAFTYMSHDKKAELDDCRIKLVDLNGNKVGGSSAWGGSVVDVDK